MVPRFFSSKALVLWVLAFPACLSAHSQGSRLSEQLGNLDSVQKTDHGVLLRTSDAWAELSVYGPDIVRVRISKGAISPDFSYAVTGGPEGDFSRMVETDSTYQLFTDSVEVVVYRDPLRIQFYTRKGQLLSGDDPALGVSWLGHEVTSYRQLFPTEKFIGLGEKTGDLNRRGSHYVDWNTDAYGYSLNQDPIYSTMPFYIGIHDSLAYGIFFDNTYKSFFDFGASTNDQFYFFGADDGEMNYYFFGASGIRGILRDYTHLTGRVSMPPIWSLGYQQCRYSYMSSHELLDIARTFRHEQIPCDVLYCDIDYMDHYKVFTWNPTTFPDPLALTDTLRGLGFHLVTIIDPGIKVEPGYAPYDEGIGKKLFARYPDGTFYTGSVWAGPSHFPDFTRADARQWWGKNFSTLTSKGVTGFWNDMNEPSAWGQDIPDLIEFGDSAHPATMEAVRAIYGMQMARSTFEGVKALMKGQRPFVLDRAAYPGIQRYSAMWTGDNNSTDDHMLLGFRLINSIGLAGEPFVGTDVGGFTGNPTPALMVRWMSLGVYSPLFRNHTAKGNTYHEPWRWGKENEDLMRTSIEQRYRLLPYLYSTFYQASLSGLPVNRSLAIDYPYSDSIYSLKYQNEFLFGDAILVAPVASDQDSAEVFFPKCGWYRMSTGDYFKGGHAFWVAAPLNDLPVFVREGSIIPMQHPVQNTSEPGDSVLEIHIWKGPDSTDFLYYEDDGSSYSYQQGVYYKRRIIYDPVNSKLTFLPPEGTYLSRFTKTLVVLHGFGKLNTLKIRELSAGKAIHQKTLYPSRGTNSEISHSPAVQTWTILLPSWRNHEEISINWE